ncbi:MAG: hypothetical protein ABDH21_02520 [bacterium]
MNLYIKIGNQNIFFLFVDKKQIIRKFIFPCYVTLDRDGNICYFGPFSFLQYLIAKQTNRILDYPDTMSINFNKNSYLIKRIVHMNLIQEYEIFYMIMEYIFSFNLEKVYEISVYEDYIKYDIPYFLDIENLYYLLKNVNTIRLINFIDPRSPYFRNQKNFLRDVFGYWKYNFELVDFGDFFYFLYPKIFNFYIGEVNTIVWLRNKYGFSRKLAISFGMRKIRELVAIELSKKNIFPKYTELQQYSIQTLLESSLINLKVKEYVKIILYNLISELIAGLSPTLIEDLYYELEKSGSDCINCFRSVASMFENLHTKIFCILNQLIIRI